MDLIIKINLDNAAFEDSPLQEVRRILDALVTHSLYATGVRDLQDIGMFDSNGNSVGSVEVTP